MSCFRNQNDKVTRILRRVATEGCFVPACGAVYMVSSTPAVVRSLLFALCCVPRCGNLVLRYPKGRLSNLAMRAFQDMLLGPLKAVLMRVLQQQLSKYIHNIELEELGLMGGDVVLENLGVTCRCWRTAPEKMTACVYEGCTCMHSQPSTAEDDAEKRTRAGRLYV